LEYLVAKIIISLENKLALESLDKEEKLKQLLVVDSLAATTIAIVVYYSVIPTRVQELVF